MKKLILTTMLLSATILTTTLGFTSSKTTSAITSKLTECATTTNAYSASSARIVMEQSSGRIFEESNAYARLPMASTTKVLTAITALEFALPDEQVTIPASAVGIEGSSIYLTAGETLSLKDLLYGLMLRSGNDSAEAIAHHVGGRELFIERMNQVAKKAGAENSNFTNPHGLSEDDHYTTAYDLALITKYAFENPLFRQISATKSHRATNSDGYTRVFLNKNKILGLTEGGNGVKTGFTKRAGRCLVASAERDGMQLISVVLNVGDMWDACIGMMNRGFANYQMRQIGWAGVGLMDAPNLCLKRDIFYPVSKNDEIVFHFQVDGKELKVFAENHLLFSENLVTMEEWLDLINSSQIQDMQAVAVQTS